MVRTKDGDGIKSNLIVAEVQKRPCLFDTNDVYYSDRLRKERCWDEVCECVVPGWDVMRQFQKLEAVREVQKRWRSIRDSYTKAFRQGKCVLPAQCQPGSRRHQYHTQMSFLLRALQNKKPRYSQDKMNSSAPTDCVQEKYESFSEVSNSPQHPPPEDPPKVEEKPLDLKTKVEDRPETVDKGNQAAMSQGKPIEINNPSVEIKIDANSILPDDYFDDDKMFMNSLLPLFKKMNDDTRLLCRIEVLKIIRYLLRGETKADTSTLSNLSGGMAVHKTEVVSKEEAAPSNVKTNGLVVTTRSAAGTRPQRKRKTRSPSPLPYPTKRRGPGRPRKVRPPPSDSEEEQTLRKRCPKMKVSEPEDDLDTATSVAQLTMPLFMKMYNLERSKAAQEASNQAQSMQVSVKTEPVDDPHCQVPHS